MLARRESKQRKGLLKNTRYLWLKRPSKLTAKQQDWHDELLQQPLVAAQAYEHAIKFDHFYEIDDPDTAEEYLRRWITEVKDSETEPLIKFTEMLEEYRLGIPLAPQPRLQRAAGRPELTHPSRQATSPRVTAPTATT